MTNVLLVGIGALLGLERGSAYWTVGWEWIAAVSVSVGTSAGTVRPLSQFG